MTHLRYWLLISFAACAQGAVGPEFLRKWLMEVSQQAAHEEDRQASLLALKQLNAGEWHDALAGAQRLSVRTGLPNLDAQRAARDMVVGRVAQPDGDVFGALEHVAPGVFRLVEEAAPRFRWISFVSEPVYEFSVGLERGMNNYILGFGMAPPEFQPFITKWNKHAAADTIAVIGAGADDSRVGELVRNAKNEGKIVFFYQDCKFVTGALCSPETVGAFMKRAGTTVLYDSPNVRNSLFTLNEATLVKQLRAGDIRMVMITPADFQFAARVTVSHAVVTVSGDGTN